MHSPLLASLPEAKELECFSMILYETKNGEKEKKIKDLHAIFFKDCFEGSVAEAEDCQVTEGAMWEELHGGDGSALPYFSFVIDDFESAIGAVRRRRCSA